MVRLEDLKIGYKIYGITSEGLGLYAPSTVIKELSLLDTFPNKTEAVICDGGLELVTRSHEKYIFRTETESEQELINVQLQMATELLNSDKFLDRLFECATSSKRLSNYNEVPIYRIAIKMYKDNLLKARKE